MSNVLYYNPNDAFWDFVADMKKQYPFHPFFADATNNNHSGAKERNDQWPGAWSSPYCSASASKRLPHGLPRRKHEPVAGKHDPCDESELKSGKEHDNDEDRSAPRGPPPFFSQDPFLQHAFSHHPLARHLHPGSGAFGGHGGVLGREWGGHGHGSGGFGPWSSFGPWTGKVPWGTNGSWGSFGQGPWGGPHPCSSPHPWSGPHPWSVPHPWSSFHLWSGPHPWAGNDPKAGYSSPKNATQDQSSAFRPEVDVHDTPESFIIYVSLPGAKKEDVAVNWDAQKCELNITGAIQRTGEEEFLKTLAVDERKIGKFERRVRLGSWAQAVQVDGEVIKAKMENGVLRVEVTKLEDEYVEVKKVDVQ